ncbi:MAG: hypothetical protein OQK04_13405 [Kangiellaceae bacterium]|nr:hypothetical protein [Kangiellaceae bacterium]MCW8999699.1 hypothetical protein [Kangiellaceae bacterium]
MSAILQQMLAQLSDEDKAVFNQLAVRLAEVKGDVNQLSDEDRELISSMEAKYGEKIRQTHDKSGSEQKLDILETPFAQHVRQILARDLVNQFPQEEDAVKFAFENRWLPVDCQQDDLIEDIYGRFKEDIKLSNQWREEMVAVEQDKKMAVGLAWFMVIFQLNERLK